jgi:phosphoribosylformylglycinamidine synthase
MSKPRVIVLRTAGTNCDKETAFAFQTAGAEADLVHINELVSRRKRLSDYRILALPGGFTYGDDIASGKILANELKFKLGETLQEFIADGRLIIGICNGFQILVKAGLLPNITGDFRTIDATLTLNDSNKFESRWVHLKAPAYPGRKAKGGAGRCIWTHGINKVIHLPVAHGEGKFIPREDKILKILKKEGLIALEYVDEKGDRRGFPFNPNGSIENIAGICDRTGRIFGLMPHPERHISFFQSPSWTRMPRSNKDEGDGLMIFKNGVSFAKKHL